MTTLTRDREKDIDWHKKLCMQHICPELHMSCTEKLLTLDLMNLCVRLRSRKIEHNTNERT